MIVDIENSWKSVLHSEFKKPYFGVLTDFVEKEFNEHIVYPSVEKIFAAFNRCPLHNVKVVIIGQDPYHGEGQANGLCFSVAEGVDKPPSLNNIFKELNSDLGTEISSSGNLERWADQGVLLLNATLTVRASSPGSHQKKGWETFTDAVIEYLSAEKENLVFILWGAYAQKKGKVVDGSRHHVIQSAHPSPLGAYRGFWGSKPFSATNSFLESKNITPIEW